MREDELRALKEKRNTMIAELRTFNETAQNRADESDGWMNAEDTAEWEKREKELVEINKRIEIEHRTAQAVQYNPEHKTFSAEGAPQSFAEFRSESDTHRHKMAGSQLTRGELESAEYRTACYKYLAYGREGLESHDEYRVLSKGASGGGFFVPTDLADQVIRAMRFLPGGVSSLARTITTSGGETINIPKNLTHGTAAWIAESGAYTPSDETITNLAISAYKDGTKIIVSEELVTDSEFDLSSFISTEFGERLGALAEDAYVNGDGSGKPSGILLAGEAVPITALPAGQVTTTTYAAVAAAIMSVPAQYRQNMSLLVADSVFVRFVTLVDTTGRPLWSPSMGAGAPDRVLGLPIYTHPNLPAIGASTKSMIVGDFSRGYTIRQVNGVFMQRQNELHSDNGQVGFRAYTRVDGRVALADALRIIQFAAT